MLCQLKIRIEEYLEMLLNSTEAALGVFFEFDHLVVGFEKRRFAVGEMRSMSNAIESRYRLFSNEDLITI